MTRIHDFNHYVLLLLIVLHVTAVLLHWVMRQENLVAPMLHGRARSDVANPTRVISAWRALALLVLSAVAVGILIFWGGDA
jgi:hypothetical protein